MPDTLFTPLMKALDAEGFNTQLVLDGEDDSEQLWMMASEDEVQKGISWHLEMAFLPGLDKPSILRFFFPMACQAGEDTIGDTRRMILAINHLLPLPGYNLSETEGGLYYCYLMACPDKIIDTPTVIDTIFLIMQQIASTGGGVRDVAEGSRSFAEGIAALGENTEGD